MDIEYVTHASLFIKSRGTTLLTDPFYFFDELTAQFLCHYPDRSLDKKHFGRIDYLYCSHVHDDHCHKETMLALKDQVGTIILPGNQPGLADKIRSYGFESLLFLPDQSTVTLPEGIQLTNYADPNGVDNALVIQAEDVTVLHENDCQLNSDIFTKMAERFQIDYAFFPHTGIQEIYPLLLTRPKEVLQDLRQAREKEHVQGYIGYLNILKPKVVIPYSYTISYFNEDQLELNQYSRTTPPEFKRYLEESLPECVCWIMQPGDVIHSASGKVSPYHQENLWGNNLSDFMTHYKNHLTQKGLRNKKFDFGEVELLEPKLYEYFKKRAQLPFNVRDQVIALRILGKHSEKTYFIETETMTLSESEPGDKVPFMEITSPASIIAAFLANRYDSYIMLYSYRVRFRLNVDLGMSPEQECYFFVQTIMALFDYELYMRELSSPA